MSQASHLLKQPVENVEFDNQHPSLGDSRSEIAAGLQRQQKTINPKFFYDEKGSELFEQITQLPEYYPTRIETSILKANAKEIASVCGEGCVLIEPGSGSSEKVRLLLDAVRPSTYVPLDISAEFLYRSAIKLGREFPWLSVQAICADFSDDWQSNKPLPEGKRVVFYPGSTIGNLEPKAAVEFLEGLRDILGDSGGVIIGVDLHKSKQVLDAAYNDAQGVTAAFNLNVLEQVNEILDADFNAEQFDHHAFYNEDLRRIEMHLVSNEEHVVNSEVGTIRFEEGETIHTESSYKYTTETFSALAQQAGFVLKQTWLDDNELFSVHYLELP